MYKEKLYIASDHGGYQLKRRLIRYVINELKQEITDLGPESYDETDDYPDYVIPLAKKVADEGARGIVICKNGIGVCIATNKVKGIKAGLGYNIDVAKSMMGHDNTNILCLPAKLLSDDHAITILKQWLDTEFSEEKRHIRRLDKINELE
ncbi:MAG: RpiB/LacA/LacB family sugar-phosphate isomerase [Candidatus Magasanikbacteria bacterium]|jgi:ribose 5-phosphate isomerase B|nr:RpiB/LacA/LacB family sugar-phosphate isomerase [Candidatus Magasanikbacteria bacterium]MBT4071439.1 RpiB/LacA/LacB family sugar-phosphate isomerase [Candidatus Magasanikbacteria bacterium]